MDLFNKSSIISYFPSIFCPIWAITTILEHKKNKQKRMIIETLHISNIQPKLNRINFKTNANVLKWL